MSYVMSHYFASVEERRFEVLTGLDSNVLDSNVLETTTLEQTTLDPSLIRSRVRLRLWSRVATRTYVVMVLLSAALYLISRVPGVESPFWFSPVLSAFTFVSAYLVYKTWQRGERER